MKCDWDTKIEDYGTKVRLNHELLRRVRLYTTRNDMADSDMDKRYRSSHNLAVDLEKGS
jgi:hypothetical protein